MTTIFQSSRQCFVVSELAPGSVSYVEISENQITAYWTASDGDIEGYILSCESDEHGLNVTENNYLNATCDGLSPGTEYNITLTSVKTDLEPVQSSPVAVKTSRLRFHIPTSTPEDRRQLGFNP